MQDYDAILSDIITKSGAVVRPGDIVDLGDGHKFTYHGLLGKGSTTAILDIGEGRALRIPLMRNA